MIQMLPLRDRSVLEELNRREGTGSGLAYCLYAGEDMLGYLLYDMTKEEARMQALNAPDEAMADGLIRSAFASLLDFGVDRAVFSARFDQGLLERLGFVQDGGKTTPSIRDILYKCKNCKK